ncbi:membrane protein, partial [Phytophthora palmivora]
MTSWVPWTLLLAFLPTSATELLKDEVERQRLREELARVAKDYSKLLLLWVFRAAQVFAGISFLFATAFVLYGLLYYVVIPSRFHEQEIFFNYGHRHRDITQPAHMYVPTATLNLLDPVHQWQSMIPQPHETTQSVLVPGVKYDVIVELTVPESRANAEVGVFMVSTSLFEGDKRQLATSARPVTLHDMPTPVRWLRLGFWLIPYTLGFTEPAQTLRVTAINGYMEDTEYPLTRVDVELNTPKLQ